MAKMIALFIDGQDVSVPEGTLIVDAAKKCGNDIPVFCYHPKMEPVGMCRMCLVEIGRPLIDRASNQPVLETDGSPRIQFGPKLETACTTPVSAGMRVVTASDKVKAARHDVLEFLLTSHPLDCPICDKGGECPLQNLTLRFGPGTSRFELDEKMRLAKHVPLGELIVLDRERCIQCGRCVRFEHDLAGDAVINFSQRGRALEIITTSDPGFDSIFSGDTTDICPVGALTTVDFRFGARPWELNTAASLCNHCPVGCNIVYNVRREGISGGKSMIKRVLPRQNEAVNEIWICDRGRFGYHYTESPQRLKEPLVRNALRGELRPASWKEALDLIEAHLRDAGDDFVTLAGGRLANEDLFDLAQLGGKPILYSFMGGGDLTVRYGLTPGSNFGEMGKGSAILVVASDLHEEAPLWWLRIKQAVQRGATLMVINPRQTRLDDFATHVVRCAYGDETATMRSLLFPDAGRASDEIKAVAQAFTAAENGVILFGSEGLGLPASTALAHACADLLVKTQHTGRPNNGLVGVWPNGNTQGAWDMGFRPSFDLPAELRQAKVAIVAAADPAGDDPALAVALEDGPFLVVQELFLTDTAKMADVILPVQAYTEREGTYTSGERRVQRFYPAVRPLTGLLPDFAIAAQLGQRLERPVEGRSASRVMDAIAAAVPAYAGLTYPKLAESPEQWPLIGRGDLYYGGSTYDNHQGLGVALPLVDQGVPAGGPQAPEKPQVPDGGLLVVPVSHLYDRGATLAPSTVLQMRMISGVGWLNPATASRLGLAQGAQVSLSLNGAQASFTLHLDATVPADALLLPRLWPLAVAGAMGIPAQTLTPVLPHTPSGAPRAGRSAGVSDSSDSSADPHPSPPPQGRESDSDPSPLGGG